MSILHHHLIIRDTILNTEMNPLNSVVHMTFTSDALTIHVTSPDRPCLAKDGPACVPALFCYFRCIIPTEYLNPEGFVALGNISSINYCLSTELLNRLSRSKWTAETFPWKEGRSNKRDWHSQWKETDQKSDNPNLIWFWFRYLNLIMTKMSPPWHLVCLRDQVRQLYLCH